MNRRQLDRLASRVFIALWIVVPVLVGVLVWRGFGYTNDLPESPDNIP